MCREKFEIRRAGRVVRHNGLYHAIFFAEELGPKAVLVSLIADGRAAFVSRVPVAYHLGSEREVVEARFRGYLHTSGSSFLQQWNSFKRRKVYNV